MKCLDAECNLGARNRGLCFLHYQRCYRAISVGKTSWKALIKQGKALRKIKNPYGQSLETSQNPNQEGE